MGLFDQLAGQALGALGGGNSNRGGGDAGGIADQFLPLLQNLLGQHGGLEGLLQQFAAKGLGNHAASWVSTGQNLPVNGDQITHVLGSDKIPELAQQAGLPASAVSHGLADLLPKVVDHLTPNGRIGGHDVIQSSLQKLLQGGLSGLLGR